MPPLPLGTAGLLLAVAEFIHIPQHNTSSKIQLFEPASILLEFHSNQIFAIIKDMLTGHLILTPSPWCRHCVSKFVNMSVLCRILHEHSSVYLSFVKMNTACYNLFSLNMYLYKTTKWTVLVIEPLLEVVKKYQILTGNNFYEYCSYVLPFISKWLEPKNMHHHTCIASWFLF